MLTPTGKHLRIVITILVLGLAFSILYGEAGRDAQAATTTLPARSVICVSDVNFNGFIDRPEAVDGVTSYLVEIPLPGLGRPLTRPEAVELVTYYLLNLTRL